MAEDVKTIKSAEEIKKLMKSQEPVVIFYYAEWCPHCKVMQQPFKQLRDENKGEGEFVRMESNDIPEDIKSKFAGYPFFVKVQGGEVVNKANGSMSKDQLKSKLLGPPTGGRRRRLSRRGLSRRRLTRRLRRGTRKSSHRSL